jgi:hypothetical protein
MTLDEAQRKTVANWIQQGLKLSEIQNRLGSELGLRLTYMEVRMLVDDLKLVPKDVEAPATPNPALAGPNPASKPAASTLNPAAAPPSPAGVSVAVDQITRPGALVSGKVTFSDGKTADWYLDQTGRLGLVPKEAGYRPPASDVQQFQMALENELSKIGF